MIIDRHRQPAQRAHGTLYNEFAPSPQLAPYVACYWTISCAHGIPATKIRVLPDGCMDAIFDLTGGLVPLGVSRPVDSRPTAFITGVSSTPTVIALPDSPRIAAIRFKPGGAVPFINIAASELAETSADLDDVFPHFTQLAVALTGEVQQPKQMALVLDRLLMERLNQTPKTNSVTAHAVAAMSRSSSVIRVKSLVQKMGVSQKKLERTIKHHTGLTPKKLSRTVRFISVIRFLHATPSHPLTDLALDLGFTDQAHFNHEFKSMTGLSPTQWLAEQHDVDFLQYTKTALP